MKERRKRTSNIQHRTSNDEVDPRFRGDDPGAPGLHCAQQKAEGTCEECRFSREVSGLKEAMLICEHKAESEDKCVVVEAAGVCDNFDDCGHTPAELAEALAEGAKLIPLTQDKVAIVDAEDYDRLSKYKWCVGRIP